MSHCLTAFKRESLLDNSAKGYLELRVDNCMVSDQGCKVSFRDVISLIFSSSLVQNGEVRFYLRSLFSQETHFHHPHTILKVRCTRFSGFLCRRLSPSSESTRRKPFFQLHLLSIFCIYSLLLRPLPLGVTIIFYCYAFARKNQVVNTLRIVKSLCSVRSATVRKIPNIGLPSFTA